MRATSVCGTLASRISYLPLIHSHTMDSLSDGAAAVAWNGRAVIVAAGAAAHRRAAPTTRGVAKRLARADTAVARCMAKCLER